MAESCIHTIKVSCLNSELFWHFFNKVQYITTKPKKEIEPAVE